VTPDGGGAPWSSDDVAALRSGLDAAFAHTAAVAGAHTGLYAVDARGGALLYARLADDEFMPASTLKLVVGSVALSRLGSAFRFHTQALLTTAADGTTDLTLRGGGDPFLDANDVAALATAVAAAGVTRIGALTIDSSYFDAQPYPPGWVWDDFPFYYAPVVTATTFEENVLHVSATGAASVGAPATVTTAPLAGAVLDALPPSCPQDGPPQVFSRVTTSAGSADSTLDVARSLGGCILAVGTVPRGGSDTADAAVPSPEAYVRLALTAALGARHVAVADAAPQPQRGDATSRIVWAHDSEPLPNVVADMWQPSDNLVAELLLKALGVARSGVPGTTENGAALEREWLQGAGVDPNSVTLRDGSGLSIYDRITPRGLVKLLLADWNGPYRKTVLTALPVAGVRGTLREEFVDTPAAGRAFVKTGSMTHVRGLAGYVQTRSHGAVAFALMVDDWNGKSPPLDAFRGNVLTRLLGT
jgi:serine-type D-Ala-D-Ala carboxypeptidase/endopeptidase (penicillin-binding protein 4)